jgi:hypothetical protein
MHDPDRPGAEAPAGDGVEKKVSPERFTTQELLWVRLSQSYTLEQGPAATTTTTESKSLSPVQWEARSRPLPSLELWWKGNFDVYGAGVGYQNVSLSWKPAPWASLRGEWRTVRDSPQDFLDLGVSLGTAPARLEARSRYNLSQETFVENRVGVTWTSQCWEVTLGYVRWPDDFEYSVQLSLKGIGTVVRL